MVNWDCGLWVIFFVFSTSSFDTKYRGVFEQGASVHFTNIWGLSSSSLPESIGVLLRKIWANNRISIWAVDLSLGISNKVNFVLYMKHLLGEVITFGLYNPPTASGPMS